jgi:protein-L-isoaspartate(D-aspartate) O-methyltransferase
MNKPGATPSRFPLPLHRLQGEPKARGKSSGESGARAVMRPQALLHQAVVDAARLQSPSGFELDFTTVRQRLVQRLRDGAATGCLDERVLAALGHVPRHLFLDSALAQQAYEDTSLPIGHGQTISKPSVVARMLSLLFEGAFARAQGHLGRVLEIGSGCGYQAALLQALAQRVVSIERVEPLAERARANLLAAGLVPTTGGVAGAMSGAMPRAITGPMAGSVAGLIAGAGLPAVQVLFADGREGYRRGAPYESIIAAAGGEDLPPAWLEQLAVGGRLVAPMHLGPGGGQALLVVDRHAGGYRQSSLDAVHFVPLKSGTA